MYAGRRQMQTQAGSACRPGGRGGRSLHGSGMRKVVAAGLSMIAPADRFRRAAARYRRRWALSALSAGAVLLHVGVLSITDARMHSPPRARTPALQVRLHAAPVVAAASAQMPVEMPPAAAATGGARTAAGPLKAPAQPSTGRGERAAPPASPRDPAAPFASARDHAEPWRPAAAPHLSSGAAHSTRAGMAPGDGRPPSVAAPRLSLPPTGSAQARARAAIPSARLPVRMTTQTPTATPTPTPTQTQTPTATANANANANPPPSPADSSGSVGVAEAPVALPGVATEPVPVYATRIPPSATLRYTTRRGVEHGAADLQWRAAADGYELRLESRLGAAPARMQVSAGGFDAAGIAPERYTDARQRRAALAANFQRAAGKISFSGSTQAFPLQPGSQDRISWLVQLAAIVAADPARSLPGALTLLAVAGVRGEPAVWTFRSESVESADLEAANSPAALRLVREREGLWDSRIEVWLDPARHHLPVRVRFAGGPESQALDMVLEELEWTGTS